MSVDSNYKDLLRAFDRHHVRYLIAGGFAVMAYTEPRFTKDLDVWVDPDLENAKNVLRALGEFGAPVAGADATDARFRWRAGAIPVKGRPDQGKRGGRETTGQTRSAPAPEGTADTLKSDTPRIAGGLMSWAASKAVGPWV